MSQQISFEDWKAQVKAIYTKEGIEPDALDYFYDLNLQAYYDDDADPRTFFEEHEGIN